MAKRVAVVGGGLAGLSGAIRLALLGFEVELFEKTPQLGGKMGTHEMSGYYFDTGPSLLTLPDVLDDLSQAAGVDRGAELDYVALDPLCRYFFADGSTLDASTDFDEMASALTALSPGSDASFRAFMEYAARIYRLTAEIFLHTPIHEVSKLLRWRYVPTLARLPQIDPFRTLHQSVSRYFDDPRIVQLFDRYATYNGSDPYQAPATLNIIAHVEYGIGGYYVQGGMYRLVQFLEAIAHKCGVQVHTSVPVERIVHHDHQVRGVQVDGQMLPMDYVLCNADVIVSHEKLLDVPQQRDRLSELEPSLAGLVFLWGVRDRYDTLAHHNVIFSADYRSEFAQMFEDLRAPNDPTVYIAITSKSDPDHAPQGCENWFVLLNMPYLAGQDWQAETQRMRRTVLDKLRTLGLDIETSIECERVLTPQDFAVQYASNRGSIYGLSSNDRNMAFKRPPNRSRDVRGLYFAGGSTHPGGGIPLVLLSGKIAAELIAEAEGIS